MVDPCILVASGVADQVLILVNEARGVELEVDASQVPVGDRRHGEGGGGVVHVEGEELVVEGKGWVLDEEKGA